MLHRIKTCENKFEKEMGCQGGGITQVARPMVLTSRIFTSSIASSYICGI